MPQKRRPASSSAAISGQLREIIAGRGMTAYSVAQAAEVAPSVISRFLSRERGLTLETFDAIAGALGLRLVETGRGRGRPAAPRRVVARPASTPDRLAENPETGHPGPLRTTPDHPYPLDDGPGYDESPGPFTNEEGSN